MSQHKRVLAVGGANAERILVVDPKDFRLGEKHTLEPQSLKAGGSSVNHSCRLLAAKAANVDAVLPVANDETGAVLKEALDQAGAKGGTTCKFDWVSGEGVATPFTTILTVGAERTIINEFPEKMVPAFAEHLRGVLDGPPPLDLSAYGAVMIGHIHADREPEQDPDPNAPPRRGYRGALSQMVINGVAACSPDHRPFLFANFGSSQFSLGADYWGRVSALQHVDCFQLDINEVRRFCRDSGAESLREILDWFSDKCTVVITLERMGAVGRVKDRKKVVFAWPYDLRPGEAKDTTGAGDGFGAAVVATALSEFGGRLDTDEELAEAMDEGRAWGAYACKELGGAYNCASRQDLEDFRAERDQDESEREALSRIMSMAKAAPIVKMLDRAFPFG